MSFLSDAYIDDALSEDEFTRKRRRDEQSVQHNIDRRPFTIQTDPSDPFSQPRTFTPLCLLSRAQLPLAYLDTAQNGSRLFAAVIPILETCHEFDDDASVLAMEDQREGRLYAVERVRRRKYALCRLGTWVKEQDVMGRAKLDVRCGEPSRKRHALLAGGGNLTWWMSAKVEPKNEAGVDGWVNEGQPKLRMLSAALPTHDSTIHDETEPGVHDQTEPIDAVSSTLGPSSAALEELAKQYMDAIYLSRTPLAYFAKGPLARARAAFSTQPTELISFLRGAILSSSVMDKKFRDIVADHVKELPAFDPEEASATKPKPRKKRKWKPKRDKFGLFVDEKSHIEQWWRRDDGIGGISSSAENIDTTLKRRTPKLRSRETFLQIILILETLALEANVPAADLVPACDAQESQTQAVESQPIAEEKKTKKKKEIDISATLESLVDRLCIWHSLEANSPVKTGTNGSGGVSDEVNDDLKTFASEVIMPFYGSRIPERANATSKKLGGPTLPTPGKKASAPRRKPGEPAVRQALEKTSRKPLGRVSTETLNRPDQRPPILHRSATDSDALAPLIKREHSEAPVVLESIATSKPTAPPAQARPQKRVSLLQQMSANRREVDLSAMSKANEQKMRTAAKVQEQVRDAIVTLKKPNRQMANEEMAKNTDEKFAQIIGKGKTGSHVRKTVTKSAVDATPRVVKATPAPRRRTQQRSEKSTSMVPSSSARLFARPVDQPSSIVAVPQTGHRPRHTTNVEDTPSRGFAHYMPKGLASQPGTLLDSPTANRTAPISETPSRPVTLPGLAVSPPARSMGFAGRLEASQSVGATPLKSREEMIGGGGNDSRALYADLGWDESDDYEELD